MLNTLESLCNLCATSGDEDAVRDFITERLNKINSVTYKIDPLGNILVTKEGEKRATKKLLVTAHMDEVGFIVTYIHHDGTLSIAPVGGIDINVAIGRQILIGKEHIRGVIGLKPIHLLSKEERDVLPTFDNITVDIGTNSAMETRELVSLGDFGYFPPNYQPIGETRIDSKAIDDRVGCALLLEMLMEDAPYDYTAAFLVEEEIGTRGAKTAAYCINPDFAIVLEATTAADIDGISADKRVCVLGDGPVISFMDRATIYDRALYRLAFDVAKEQSLPCQTKTRIAGGNDAGAIHVSRTGVRSLAMSLPCRYLHAPAAIADTCDIDAMTKLLPHLCTAILERDI